MTTSKPSRARPTCPTSSSTPHRGSRSRKSVAPSTREARARDLRVSCAAEGRPRRQGHIGRLRAAGSVLFGCGPPALRARAAVETRGARRSRRFARPERRRARNFLAGRGVQYHMSLCGATPWVLAASMRVGAALKDGVCGAKKRDVIGQPPCPDHNTGRLFICKELKLNLLRAHRRRPMRLPRSGHAHIIII